MSILQNQLSRLYPTITTLLCFCALTLELLCFFSVSALAETKTQNCWSAYSTPPKTQDWSVKRNDSAYFAAKKQKLRIDSLKIESEQQWLKLLNQEITKGNSYAICYLITHKREALDIPLTALNHYDAVYRYAPIHLAALNGRASTIRLLKKNGADLTLPVQGSKNQAIHLASKSKYGFSALKELIKQGVDIESKGTHDHTPLASALAHNNVKAARYLYLKKANVLIQIYQQPLQEWAIANESLMAINMAYPTKKDLNTLDQNGYTSLHYAAIYNKTRIARFLLKKGANPNILDRTLQMPPIVLSLLYKNIQVADILLSVSNIDSKNKIKTFRTEVSGKTLLHIAVNQQQSALVKKAILLGVPVNEKDSNGQTALDYLDGQLKIMTGPPSPESILILEELFSHDAINAYSKKYIWHALIKYGSLDQTQKLFTQNNVAELLKTSDDRGQTPLHIAAANGRYELIAPLIFYGAEINAIDIEKQTPLHLAAANSHTKTVRELLKHKANPLSKGTYGKTPLHLAVKGSLDTVLALLEYEKSVDLVNAKDDSSFTPLHEAARYGQSNVILTLIDHGAPLNSVDLKNLTPLHVAASTGHLAATLALIHRGANLEARTDHGQTPLELAAQANHTETTIALIRNGTQIDTKNEFGLMTPLHNMVIHGNIKSAQALLNQDSSLVHVQNRLGQTPIFYSRDPEITLLLLEKGATTQIKDYSGKTPLHFAARTGNQITALLLIQNGAAVDEKDQERRSPLYLAIDYKHTELALKLIELGANPFEIDRYGLSAIDMAHSSALYGLDKKLMKLYHKTKMQKHVQMLQTRARR